MLELAHFKTASISYWNWIHLVLELCILKLDQFGIGNQILVLELYWNQLLVTGFIVLGIEMFGYETGSFLMELKHLVPRLILVQEWKPFVVEH